MYLRASIKLIFTCFVSIFMLQTAYGQSLLIDSLKAINLEEDKGPFATMNDEVFLIWGIVSIEFDSLVYWNHSEIIELSDSTPSLIFNKNLSPRIDSTDLVFIILVEVDDLQTAENIAKIVQEDFLTYYAHPYSLLKEQIRVKLGDNDLLGFLYYALRNSAKFDHPTLFKGMHLFNRFEYELYWRIE